MKLKRLCLTVGSALLLAVLGFVALQGVSVLAQDPNQPGLIVFASDRTGNYEIYVLDPQTGLMTQLTNAPGDDIEPQWSPDGQFIVFVSARDGDYEVFAMRADGTDVRQLTNNTAEDRQPRWQPGGGHVVYASDVNGQWDLYVVSADGAIVRQLTNDMFDERGPVPQAVVGPGPGPGPVSTPFPTLTPQAAAQPDAIVNPSGATNVNVRAQPGTGAQIVTRLRRGDPVTVIAKYYDHMYDESWVQIQAADGTVGWIYEPILALNISLANVPAVAAQFVPPPATSTPAATAEPTADPNVVVIEFWADAGEIIAGDCTNIHWRVQNIQEVYFEGGGVVGEATHEVCPVVNTTYNLRVIRTDGVEDNRYITITVNLP
ncbi:MAG: SH3 domain-containing protein [Anaerolineae bacterium]|nr:SH3 domain-containing protein [Anaerolineae bacterium]